MFTSTREDTNGLYLMRADGSEPHYLAPGWNAQWSPDGRWIAFQHSLEIYRIRADGTDMQQLTDDVLYLDGFPQWAPVVP